MKFFFLFFFSFLFLHADEVRPCYLELTEKSPNNFKIVFKVPAKGDKKLSLNVVYPKSCKPTTAVHANFTKSVYSERYNIMCQTPLAKNRITVEGLQNTRTDLLLRLEFLDKSSQSILLTPSQNSYKVKQSASSFQVVGTYTWLGITHILLGFDHLMFVFALLLIVDSIRKLLLTITAFTLAHSITLAGSSLGVFYLPQKPVEAVIALSILFLAVEIINEGKGIKGITSRYPWIVAFIFGLLHGFGFAGALAEIGLPQNALTLALVFFNVGVELGQLAFVATVILLSALLQKVFKEDTKLLIKRGVVYLIGITSTFWLVERVFSF